MKRIIHYFHQMNPSCEYCPVKSIVHFLQETDFLFLRPGVVPYLFLLLRCCLQHERVLTIFCSAFTPGVLQVLPVWKANQLFHVSLLPC